mgnify:FL=1
MAEVKIKTVSYKPGNGPEENSSGYDPLYGAEGENLLIFPRDRIKPWWTDDDKTKGIMSTDEGRRYAQMTELETRKYLGGFLTNYGFSEEEILKMPMWELELHLERIMNQ